MSEEFEKFDKIQRLFKYCCVTEKIDGTNAQVHVLDDGSVLAGSRNRYLTVGEDNFGFAKWVSERAEELRELGPGRHYGEWWGCGIQRRYGLTEKRFSLFNVGRWGDVRPECCHVVPVLYEGDFDTGMIRGALTKLGAMGSHASPGFMNPEGIVVFHGGSYGLFKATFDHDAGKWTEAS